MKMCMQETHIQGKHTARAKVAETAREVESEVHDSASVHNRDMFHQCDSICCVRNR